ncbi:STP1 protein [Plasmodium ovale curtisi]|uniref:STP1 protein n=1 Tax=Plasmodium ovale curtisi TaxID=864141 RepID=A0A1A8X8Z1_PLAOA|nr:STP1 protein [Plasmodium ovale curtisi]
MADHSGYTILTKYIPVEFFIDLIKSPIKKLIHKYGHKNCGLRHEELCEEIKKIISDNKKIELKHMDEAGKKKWISDWDRQRNGFFNKLFEEEGFINMCYPPKKIGNPSLYQLKSKHIQFCKKKDERRLALEKKNEYSVCRQYNSWIDTERKSFTREYLSNVSNFNSRTVNKYFSTKEHPRGHDPSGTYLKSKVDCEIYNPASEKYQKKTVEKTPKNKLQLSRVPNIRQGSQEKDGRSVEDGDTASAKTKTDVKKLSQNEPPPDSLTFPLINTKVDSTANGQYISLKPKAHDSSVNRDGGTKESTPTQGEPPTNNSPTSREEAPPQAGSPPLPPKDARLTPAIQSVSAPNATISLSSSISTVPDTTSSKTPVTSSNLTVITASSLNSGSSSPSDPLLPAVVTKDQDKPPHSTTTPVTSANTHSTKTLPEPSAAVPSLAQPKPPTDSTPPAKTEAQGPGTPASSSASTFTTTVTTTTAAPNADTIPTMSTAHEPISFAKQAPSAFSSQESLPTSAAVGPKATASTTEPQQTVIHQPTSLSGSDTEIISVKTKPSYNANYRDPGTKSASAVLSKPKGTIQDKDNPLSMDTQHAPGHPSRMHVTIPDSKVQGTPHHRDQPISPVAVQHTPNIGVVSSASDKSRASVNTPIVNTKNPSTDDSTVRTNKNDNPSFIPEGIPPLMHIIPTLLVILATITLLFQLYKYTPFGFLLGRRRKRKKQDLRRILEIPEKHTYESPNIALHEWEDHNLVGQTKENDVYIKLFKINRYKQEMQKSKKKNKTTLIEVHMEVLEEYKSAEWELHKGDFLEICLRGFINEENEAYQNFSNSELIVNNIKNEKTIEDIQKQEILWNNWIENHRNILEQWKEKEWFHILKNKWRNEQQNYKEKNDKLRENILNEQETHSIVSQKDIWKQWISKQATLIDLFNKEDWFKSIVYVQDKEKDNYHINEYNNISVTSKTRLKNEKMNHEHGKSKNIIQKLMVQIHMMVLEECIKEDIIKHKELCIDNFIEDIHNQNNYDEKRNIPQCDTDDFSVPQYEEIHTSTNK